MTGHLFTKIIKYIEKNNLIKFGDTIIIGLSGGPDSVFLLRLLKLLQPEYKLQLIAAHLDHEWRAESAQDAEFCKKLCDEINVSIVSAKASQITLARKTKSLEERGRLLRRTFFEKLAREYKATSIALAHHADDQEETFFIRLLRGSTLTGLTCMRSKTGLYIRPLLEIYKTEILDYFKTQLQTSYLYDGSKKQAPVASQLPPYVIDPTNESEKFLRNKIRKFVIPALRSCDARFDANFSKTISYLQETEDYLEHVTQKQFEKISSIKDHVFWINIKDLLACDQFIIKRMIVYWLCKAQVPFVISDKFIEEILRFLNNTKAQTHEIHDQWQIVKTNSYVAVAKTPQSNKQAI